MMRRRAQIVAILLIVGAILLVAGAWGAWGAWAAVCALGCMLLFAGYVVV